MLKFYLTSIFIFAFIMFGGFMLFGDKIKENGWVDESKKNSHAEGIFALIWMSSIPIFRLLIVVFIFVAACYTKEQFEKMVNESSYDIEDGECYGDCDEDEEC